MDSVCHVQKHNNTYKLCHFLQSCLVSIQNLTDARKTKHFMQNNYPNKWATMKIPTITPFQSFVIIMWTREPLKFDRHTFSASKHVRYSYMGHFTVNFAFKFHSFGRLNVLDSSKREICPNTNVSLVITYS